MVLKKKAFAAVASGIFIYMMLFISCNGEKQPVEEDTGMPAQSAMRFEQDLFADGPTNPAKLREKYPFFFDLFFFQVVRLGSPDSAVLYNRVKDFATDSDIVAIGRDAKALYADFSPIDKKLARALDKYKEEFPKRIVPKTLTFISGFNNAILCSDSLLGIGLDMYLGPGSKYYQVLEFPVYRTSRMTGDYIPADAMKGWLQSEWTEAETNADLLSHMIYLGKIQYVLKALMPNEPDSLRTGYSQQQLEWCEEHEKNTWSFFIDHKLLFSTDQNAMMKYVTDGPTTNGFPKEAPGNIGQWIGTRIVDAYMEQNNDLPLEKLMADNDYKKILQASKYKP